MHLDARGLPVSTASAKAAAAFDHLVTGCLTYRADTPSRCRAEGRSRLATSRLHKLLANELIAPNPALNRMGRRAARFSFASARPAG